MSVVTATFPSFEGKGPSRNCHELERDVDRLACDWKGVIRDLGDLGEQENTAEWQASITKVSQSCIK